MSIPSNQTVSTGGMTPDIGRNERFSVANPPGIQDYTFDEAYKVTILSRQYDKQSARFSPICVESYLQGETLEMSVENEWESFDFFKGGLIEKAAQVFGHSFKNTFMTRRMWTGTRPLKINVPLKFVALTDASKNVLEAVKTLMSIAAPGVTEHGFLTPPGPNPFYEDHIAAALSALTNGKVSAPQLKGRMTAIWIGKYLFFPSVLISDIQPSFSNIYDAFGNPMAASVNVIFETYQLFTQSDIDETFPKISLAPSAVSSLSKMTPGSLSSPLGSV